VVDEAAGGGPVGHLVARAQLQLAQHRPDVGLDRARADAEPHADLLVGIPAREVVQDLSLARRERLQAGLWRLGLDRGAEGLEYERGEAAGKRPRRAWRGRTRRRRRWTGP